MESQEFGGRLDREHLVQVAMVEVLGEVGGERSQVPEIRDESRPDELSRGELDGHLVAVAVPTAALMPIRQSVQAVGRLKGEGLADGEGGAAQVTKIRVGPDTSRTGAGRGHRDLRSAGRITGDDDVLRHGLWPWGEGLTKTAAFVDLWAYAPINSL